METDQGVDTSINRLINRAQVLLLFPLVRRTKERCDKQPESYQLDMSPL